MTRPPNATFSCHLRDDVVVVQFTGEIDAADTGHIADSLTAAILLANHLVVVDLSGLTFLDVAATRVIRQVRTWGFQEGISVVLAAPTPTVAHLLSRTDPEGSLPVYDSVELACGGDPSGRAGHRRLHSVPPISSSVVGLSRT